ncbi:unnamed protein product [Rotaria sordida]|uniref:Uncharacterized protein n=2 Tax=Rotaria sordida TaxID=392033 RepID=A0A815VBD0_9BILA|nr:unnamed protein product [Rotaria sordida]
MLLYQHTIQCSQAIQMFLDKNQSYWAFVPMTYEKAHKENLAYRTTMYTTATTHFQLTQDPTIQNRLAHIPQPPPGYKFSKRQIETQVEFFKKNLINEQFVDDIYVYNAKIIAVMPPNTSDLFRRIVHSLFVTHTETKLNALGHIFTNPDSVNIRNGIWCANLIHRTIVST